MSVGMSISEWFSLEYQFRKDKRKENSVESKYHGKKEK
jgi:hypothetical protein